VNRRRQQGKGVAAADSGHRLEGRESCDHRCGGAGTMAVSRGREPRPRRGGGAQPPTEDATKPRGCLRGGRRGGGQGCRGGSCR
jgi:hypothetical protein